MLRWRRAKRRRKELIRAAADEWMARHGWYAYALAGERAIDAFLAGDYAEQERWSDIRAVIRNAVVPEASPEQLILLLKPRPPSLVDDSLFRRLPGTAEQKGPA